MDVDMSDIFIVLENKKIFKGKSFGAVGSVVGEIVFTTSMTGYLETLTDPSYYGQMVVHTFPLIGNYGVIPADFESDKIRLKAYIVKNWCQEPSNFRNEGCIDTFLMQNNIIGLYDIDTRALTKIIREYGVMNSAIVSEIPEDLDSFVAELKKYKVVDAVKSATCSSIVKTKGVNSHKTVVLWDFGAKQNIERSLLNRGCDVIRVPATTKAEEILKYNPDGIMLTNGPGDPAENVEIINELKKITSANIPIFGICLGHQLLALSQGAKTSKLKYGHRGSNQPVIDTKTGRVYITSQNHGYAVESDTLPSTAVESFKNGNDGTNEGVEYQNIKAFSVQFHPEAAGGPLDTEFLFDKFVDLMGGKN